MAAPFEISLVAADVLVGTCGEETMEERERVPGGRVVFSAVRPLTGKIKFRSISDNDWANMETRLYCAEAGVIKRNSCYSSDANVRIPLTVPLWLAFAHGTGQSKSEQFTDISSFAQSQWSL